MQQTAKTFPDTAKGFSRLHTYKENNSSGIINSCPKISRVTDLALILSTSVFST